MNLQLTLINWILVFFFSLLMFICLLGILRLARPKNLPQNSKDRLKRSLMVGVLGSLMGLFVLLIAAQFVWHAISFIKVLLGVLVIYIFVVPIVFISTALGSYYQFWFVKKFTGALENIIQDIANKHSDNN